MASALPAALERASAFSSSTAPDATRATLERPQLTGVSAAGLLAAIDAAGGRAALEGKTTGALKYEHVLPTTAAAAAAYSDELRTRPHGAALVGPASAFRSHAYDYLFLDAVDAAVAWGAAHPRADASPHFFYFDLLVVDQHGQNAVVGFEALRDEFGGGVRAVGTTLFLLDFAAPISLGRSWCVFEAATALSCGLRFEVVMPPRDEAAFALALVDDFDSLVRKTCTVDVARATAREPADQAIIQRAVREDMGGFLRVNQLVIGAMREWMVAAGYAALLKLPKEERAVSALQNALAILLKDQGKLSEAEPLYREALAGRRKALGDDHPDTLGSVNNFACLLQDQGKLSEAEPLYRKALAGRRKALGDDHPDTLTSLSNFAILLKAQGKLSEAEPLYRDALAGRRKALGNEHPDTLRSVGNFAILLSDQGKLSEAEPLYREALAGRRMALGDDHPSTQQSIANLAHFVREKGRDADCSVM